MTDKERTILNTLLELERAVETLRTATPKPNLLPLFARLDELSRSLPVTTHPLLLHYLHKKSYEKARLFLQDRDNENAPGNCHGHVDEQGRPWTAEGPGASAPLAKDDDDTPATR